ncbi:hypothetical protein PHSC3_000165 [Chlamydiales bacterium STE3]|nr:hypothetical protein PHSC3_000165 [Chlamydiales bacterium STE3]
MSISLIDPNQIRNKNIEELKREIFLSKRRLVEITFQKERLRKIKENEKDLSAIGFVFKKIFNIEGAEDIAQKEMEQCSWDEMTLHENLEKLEREKRMKELVRVNEWWKANEKFFKEHLKKEKLISFKDRVFQELIKQLELDESSFLQAADEILLSVSNNAR